MNRLQSEAIDAEVTSNSSIDEPLTRDLRRLVRSKVPRDEVDDVMQDVAMAIATATTIPDEASHRRRWSFRIVLNKCALYWRRRGNHPELINAATDIPTTSPDPLLWMIQQETHHAVAAAMERLPPDMRELLTMKFIRQLTYEQLAAERGITRDAAHYRCLQAKKALRSLLLAHENTTQ